MTEVDKGAGEHDHSLTLSMQKPACRNTTVPYAMQWYMLDSALRAYGMPLWTKI